MNIDDYQKWTSTTAIFPKEYGLYYLSLGLVGEAGEIANKVKKIIRDTGGNIPEEVRERLKDEMGDVAWYLAQLSTFLDVRLSDVLSDNIGKLTKRKEENKIKGDGDVR